MSYIYTYSCHEDEIALCRLEMRSLFGFHTVTTVLETDIKVEPSRSPFMKERIEVLYEGNSLKEICNQVKGWQVGKTFKVTFVNVDTSEKIPFEKRRMIEKEIGSTIKGTVDFHNPTMVLAVLVINGRWIIGDYLESEPIWFQHQKKPHNYSTALSTRVARAVVNIAVPSPINIKAIDPCCGIGTVLIEALSMGIDIVGSDLNPIVLPGTRENLAHFGFQIEVLKRDIREINEKYDVAIIDMPYNLCSVLPESEQLEMLVSARRFASKVVIITVETIDPIIEKAGFHIVDRCEAKKGAAFSRQVLVGCQAPFVDKTR